MDEARGVTDHAPPGTPRPDTGAAGERDALGRVVREAWVDYCRETGDTKPSHLASYDDLSEWDKEADRRIGEAVRDAVLADPAAGERAGRKEKREKLRWMSVAAKALRDKELLETSLADGGTPMTEATTRTHEEWLAITTAPFAEAVAVERAYQDRTWGGADHDREHSLPIWHLILQREVGEVAREIGAIGWDGKHVSQLRAELVQVAAVCAAIIAVLDDADALAAAPDGGDGGVK